MKLLDEIRSVVKQGNFQLKGGRSSKHYIDLRSLFGNPRTLKQLVRALREKIPRTTTSLAASGYGGISLGTLLSQETRLPLSLVRNEKKDHGLKDQIIGYHPNKKDSILIVDDICTSGTSILETRQILQKLNPRKTSALVVVKRGEPKERISLLYVFSEKDILIK